MRRLLNNKKITNIPPLQEGSSFVTNFQEKASIFNSYFAEQCTPLQNSSCLPRLVFKTNSRLTEVSVTTDQIVKIINNINNNKAHGFDDVSVKMIKLCPELLSIPLKIIFEKCI